MVKNTKVLFENIKSHEDRFFELSAAKHFQPYDQNEQNQQNKRYAAYGNNISMMYLSMLNLHVLIVDISKGFENRIFVGKKVQTNFLIYISATKAFAIKAWRNPSFLITGVVSAFGIWKDE